MRKQFLRSRLDASQNVFAECARPKFLKFDDRGIGIIKGEDKWRMLQRTYEVGKHLSCGQNKGVKQVPIPYYAVRCNL